MTYLFELNIEAILRKVGGVKEGSSRVNLLGINFILYAYTYTYYKVYKQTLSFKNVYDLFFSSVS